MIVGFVGQDPVFHPLNTSLKPSSMAKGSAEGMKPGVTRFSIATNQSYKNQNGETVQKTTWHVSKSFDPLLNDVILNHVKKGYTLLHTCP
jgi:single-stranded DNA-binding protein